MRWGRLALWAVGGLLAREAWLAIGPRRWRRQEVFARAQARARERDVPLVVIGAPRAGFVNVAAQDYGCGDLCIDVEGCDGCVNAATGRAEDVLPMIPDGSAVVFVSCTLEYVDDVDLVWREARRIAGRDVFAVTVEPSSLTAWLFPGAQRRILAAPQPGESGGLTYRPLPWSRVTTDTRGLGAGRARRRLR